VDSFLQLFLGITSFLYKFLVQRICLWAAYSGGVGNFGDPVHNILGALWLCGILWGPLPLV